MANIPVYLLIDVSEKMQGDPLIAIQNALRIFEGVLNGPEHDVRLCIITFASEVIEVRELSEWKKNGDTMSKINCVQERSNIDSGLECLVQKLNSNSDTHESLPLLIFITSGSVPSEKLQDKLMTQCGFGRILVIYHDNHKHSEEEPLDDFYYHLTFDHKEFGQLTQGDFNSFLKEGTTVVTSSKKIRARGWEFQKDLTTTKNLLANRENELADLKDAEGISKRIDEYEQALRERHERDLRTKEERIKLDAEEKIRAAEEEAERQASLAVDRANKADKRRLEAEEKQREAEKVANEALVMARKEFEDERAAVREDVQNRIDTTNRETEAKIKSAREEAERQVSIAVADANEAEQKRLEAEEKQLEAETKRREAETKQREAEREKANADDRAREKLEEERATVLADVRDRIHITNRETEAKIKSVRDEADRQVTEIKEEADRQIIEAKENSKQGIASAKKEAQDRIDENKRETEAKIKSARDSAKQQVNEAEKKQIEAEKIAAEAVVNARKEFEDVRNTAETARLKAEADQKDAQDAKDEALKEKNLARDSAIEAERKQLVAEQNEQIAIANADNAEERAEAAIKSRRFAVISAIAVLLLAGIVSVYCIGQVGYANMSAVTANAELARFVQTFDERVAAATARADAREAEARETRATADKVLQDALAKQKAADEAFTNAADAQRTADATLVTAKDLDATANRKLETATEKEVNARVIEERADATMQTANNTMTEAQQAMQAAVRKDADADVKILTANQAAAERVAAADERARMERERRMGVEAMIKAGAPLQFPLEDNERNEDAQQKNEQSPVSRSTKAILREVVWRWCLEKEFGIENESGELVGEVTEKPRTGYRGSLQGCPLYDPEYVSLYDPGFVPPLGAFRRDYPYNSLSPSVKTRTFWEGKPDGSPWWWEEWWTFRTKADAMRDEIGIPPGHQFSLPRDVLPPHKAELRRRFLLTQTEVTQELWESVMGNNPSRFKDAKRPVENVSWDDTQEFIAKLNEMKEELGVPFGYEFSLPRENEWEHAARAGTSTPFHVGVVLDNKQANIGNPLGGTNAVGMYPANSWGLHDMHGNVREWCYDGLGYGPLLVQERTSLRDDFYRSLRGGSWSLGAEQSRSAYRSSGNPTRKHDDVGFRLCLAAK